MNVCFYTDQTISGMTGGIGRVTSVLTNYFRNVYGWKVYSIYAAEAKADCVKTEVDGSICLRLHDRLGMRLDVRRNVAKAAQFIWNNKVDVFVIQTSLDVAPRMAQYFIKTERLVPIACVLHFEPGKDEWRWGSGGLKGLFAPVRNWLVHRATVKAYCDACLHSEFMGVLSKSYIDKYIQYAGWGTRLVAIPNPLSFDAEPVTGEKERMVLVVARMEEGQKRISVILRLWKQLQDMGYRLVIVGDGPSLEMYKTYARDNALKNVSFEGKQDPVPYYKQASIFLMTSSFEGFPMTIVEAQQFGCVPVVYDAFSALKDVVEDGRNGMIVDNDDETSFVKSVKTLMTDDELRQRLSANAVEDCQRFAQETICAQWKELLNKSLLTEE